MADREAYKALGKEFQNNASDLEKHLPRVLEELRKDDTAMFMDECRYRIDDLFKEAKEKAKNKYEPVLIEICIESLKKKTQHCYDLARHIFEEKALVKWKGHEGEVAKMVKILEEPIEWIVKDEAERKRRADMPSWSDFGGALEKAVDHLIRGCNRDKAIKKVSPHIVRLVTSCLKSGSTMHIVVALTVADASEMTWEGNEKLFPELLEALDKWLRREDTDLTENRDNKRLASRLLGEILQFTNKACAGHIKSIMEYCMEQELEGEGTDLSGHGEVVRSILTYVMQKYDKPKQIENLMPFITKLLSCDIEALQSLAGYCIGTLYQNGEMIAPYGEQITEACLNNNQGSNLGMALKSIFQYNPEVILSRLDRIMEMLEDMAVNDKTYVYMLLDDVAKKKPEVMGSYIDLMMEDIGNATLSAVAFMAVSEVSYHYPQKFIKHLDRCVEVWEQIPYTVSYACKTIASVGRVNKKQAERCLKIMFEKMDTIDPMWVSVILMEIKRIGQAQKESLEKYRKKIESLKTSQQMGVPDLVQSMIDFLDDRSLQGLSEEVAEQREDIDNLDTRVTNTENDVKVLDETVAQQGDEIQNVKNDVAEQGEKLDDLKEVVDETVEKVEEIDHKTITNAPKWSRDVSKLLNPEHEHDWRFLAVRLGYSGEDIRNWALSPDPTMAILAEWYTTHKSSDATFAILTALEDMGRNDAAEIIKESLEEAELLVPQAPSDVSEKPPAVFLSYQWDHQPEVKAIKKHIEMAGFPCWMDIGQMGGGDQLFARISQGMRSSKLVLCMVTEKYSQSENCNKEVNLANLLNKPIIPILIDRTPWPPEGAMSMLFAQLLYIQFYNNKEYVRGEKFWDDAKFSELLGQISYYANPDEEMITDEYRNWIPQVEDAPAVVKKASEESKNTPAQQQNAIQDSKEPPTVFISYQWDKQPQVKKLFSRLSSIGFHCWLDIMQMGGGDPLYSKIDKGVRNAKVVVSCVTPKYALSANCRREVSLSDALRKPIIPILLEKMTWPPEGPMSMTLTQLLYIDFTKESSQSNFDDEKFVELLQKIMEHTPPTLTPDEEENEEEAEKEEEEDNSSKTDVQEADKMEDKSDSDSPAKQAERTETEETGAGAEDQSEATPEQDEVTPSQSELPDDKESGEVADTENEKEADAATKEASSDGKDTPSTETKQDVEPAADPSPPPSEPPQEPQRPEVPVASEPVNDIQSQPSAPAKTSPPTSAGKKKNKKSSTCLIL